MTQHESPQIYTSMALIYTSSAYEREALQATKFSLKKMQKILGNVNLSLRCDSISDHKNLFTVALTITEYFVNFIRFSLSPSTGLKYLSIDNIKLAQSNTMELAKRLSSHGPLSEESEARVLRTETCFRDVLSAIEEWRQPKERRAKRRRAKAGAQADLVVEPMFRSANIFGSEAEGIFWLRLRHLLLLTPSSHPRETLQELYDLCLELRPDRIPLSEVMIDTALRSVIIILSRAKNWLIQRDIATENFPPNFYEFLRTCFTAMSHSAHLEWKEDSCFGYKMYVQNRVIEILRELSEINVVFLIMPKRETKRPLPAMETSPNVVPHTALWQRLRSVESVAALTEGKEEEECAICRGEGFCCGDFAILSKCPHLFCVRCIEEWFSSKSTCPLCRVLTTSWTTRKHFEDFKKRKPVVEDCEQPAKRLRWN